MLCISEATKQESQTSKFKCFSLHSGPGAMTHHDSGHFRPAVMSGVRGRDARPFSPVKWLIGVERDSWIYLNQFFLLICRKVYRKETRTEKNNDNETIMIKSTNCSVSYRFVLDFSVIKKQRPPQRILQSTLRRGKTKCWQCLLVEYSIFWDPSRIHNGYDASLS